MSVERFSIQLSSNASNAMNATNISTALSKDKQLIDCRSWVSHDHDSLWSMNSGEAYTRMFKFLLFSVLNISLQLANNCFGS